MDRAIVKKVISELTTVIDKIDEVNAIASDLGCVDGTIIGTGQSDYTQGSTMYNLSIKNKNFAMIDIPGIEGDESAFEEIIRRSLEQAHTIFYVNGSGKKIEKETLLKIQKYMRDGTSVYAVFNVHCKPKKERIPGIDSEYSEELEEAYRKQDAVIKQTESELVSFLGKNYKGNISLNGLLGFCALAFIEGGRTSIKEDQEKNLRKNQEKYLKEYHDDKRNMLEDSHLIVLLETIERKTYSFETDIIDENLKKLRNRMNEMMSTVKTLKAREIEKIDGFIRIYDEFERNCKYATEDFLRTVRNIPSKAAEDAFCDLKNELYDKLEQDEGKTRAAEIQRIVELRKGDVVAKIQRGINTKIERAQKAFIDSIEDAQKRMEVDFGRELVKFEISLSANNVTLDTAFANELRYSFEDFRNLALKVGVMAISWAIWGGPIGAAVGAALGVLISIFKYFASGKDRINKAKEKIRQAIDEQIEEVAEQINAEIRRMEFVTVINDIYHALYEEAEKQKKKLMDVRRLIINVKSDLDTVYKNIA